MDTKNYKKRFGDKKDGRLIRGDELDTNHYIMPLCWPRRTDNEAFISETFVLDSVNKYLEEKNKACGEKKYSLFMFMLAVIGKTFINRPKMNRFYRNGNLYERYNVSMGFICKKTIADDGEEALARIYADPEDNFDSFAEKVIKEIEERRSEKMDKSSDDVRILMKFPHFVGKLVMGFMKFMDRKTTMPDSMTASDMFYTSAVISNLGSIGLHSGYHHLSNWGTNSFFMTIGQKKLRPFYDENGNVVMKDSLDVGMTIDERIADGVYFSRTIRLMRRLFENPELLDKPFKDDK